MNDICSNILIGILWWDSRQDSWQSISFLSFHHCSSGKHEATVKQQPSHWCTPMRSSAAFLTVDGSSLCTLHVTVELRSFDGTLFSQFFLFMQYVLLYYSSSESEVLVGGNWVTHHYSLFIFTHRSINVSNPCLPHIHSRLLSIFKCHI